MTGLSFNAFELADVDGVLCVKNTTSMENEPKFVSHYWPTKMKTRDFVRHFDLTVERLREVEVRAQFPGHFRFDFPTVKYVNAMYVDLTDGAKTLSVKFETTDIPEPPKRGKKIVYEGGCWWRSGAKWKQVGWHEIVK